MTKRACDSPFFPFPFSFLLVRIIQDSKHRQNELLYGFLLRLEPLELGVGWLQEASS